MLRAGMPPDWTAGERVVAMILADVCNDRTRRGYISNEQLCEESGLEPGSLRSILARLGRHGFELRVPLSTGKDGRPVYATSGRGRGGRAVTYECPILVPREAKDAILIPSFDGEAVDNLSPEPPKGATVSAPLPERRNAGCERRNEGSAHTPRTPQAFIPDQTSAVPRLTTSAEGARVREVSPDEFEAERKRQMDALQALIREQDGGNRRQERN
jgi:hypothetical protein